MSKRGVTPSGGYTLIELTLAMAVFSLMLLIIVAGFINIVNIHNQAVASNQVQDSARTAMDEMVRTVRNSGSVDKTKLPNILCVLGADTTSISYYISAGALVRSDGCPAGPLTNTQAITSSDVQVLDLTITQETTVIKPEYQISITVASKNGSVDTLTKTCNDNNADRNFCSVVTLTSGAISR